MWVISLVCHFVLPFTPFFGCQPSSINGLFEFAFGAEKADHVVRSNDALEAA